MNIDPQAAGQMINAQLQPWNNALENPAKAQEEVLRCFLKDYAQT